MSNELLTLTFGLLKDEFSRAVTCLNWQIGKNDVGIFMTKTEKQLSNFDKILVKKNDELIWSSNIRLAPEKNLELPFSTFEENIYISSKPIRDTEIPFGDSIYDIILISKEVEIGRGVLMVNEKREEKDTNTHQAKIYDIEDVISRQEAEIYDDAIPEVEQIKQTDRLQDTEISEEDRSEGEFEMEMEQKIEKEPCLEQKPEPEVRADFKIDVNNEPLKNTQYTRSTKTKLMEILSSLDPISISLKTSDNHEIIDYSKKDIVIEKTGNSYVAVLSNFFGRANYLLRDGERVVSWENSFTNYINWLKNILVKKYNLQSFELDNLSILVISDEENIIAGQTTNNIDIVSRNSVIKSIGRKSVQIVDIKEGCNVYIESEGKTLSLNFENSQFKDALDFLENEPTLLIGATPEKLSEKQFINSLNENKQVKITDLAWETSII